MNLDPAKFALLTNLVSKAEEFGYMSNVKGANMWAEANENLMVAADLAEEIGFFSYAAYLRKSNMEGRTWRSERGTKRLWCLAMPETYLPFGAGHSDSIHTK